MSVSCPVCQNPMIQAGNPSIHYCPKRKINFPHLNVNLDMSHATVYVSDSGRQIYSNIISAEYRFEISDVDEDSSTPKTIITRLQRNDKSSWDHSVDTQFEFMDFLTINVMVNLPWNDHSKVREAVKTYLVFS